MIKITLVLFIISALYYSINAQTADFDYGADISFIPQIENLGGKYYNNGKETDPLKVFRKNGFNYIRLRLWNNPKDGYCGLSSTLQFAQKIKDQGFKILLDFHYSDWWADPANQKKPKAWESISYNQLVDSIYAYTFKVIRDFDSLNVLPDMVQIGNEISGGFLWPDGEVRDTFNTDKQWQQFTTLLKSAEQAVKDAVPDSSISIMIHIDWGGNNSGSKYFYNKLVSYQVPFDVIGLSYYPWWQGTFTQLSQNLNDLSSTFNKDVIVVETAYPWTLQYYDNVNNIVGSTSQLHQNYPASVDGQYNFLKDLIQIVKDVPNGRGKGLFYWAPEYISVQPIGSNWENLTLFDFQGNVLNSIKAFKEIDSTKLNPINVTFRLNTSTNWDTLTSSGFVQLRGEVVNGDDILPDSEVISWNNDSQITFKNVEDDYWEKTIQALPGSEIHYKYWTGYSIDYPTFTNLGLEGKIQPYDSSSGDFRKFIAGHNDTVLQVEYYNSSNENKNQFWKPFEHKDDSVAVYFRVNMSHAMSSGRYNPEVDGAIGVRGNSLDSIHILFWDKSNLILSREDSSLNSSFWSGVIYYPLTASGKIQDYKIVIDNDLEIDSLNSQTFVVPSFDTTLGWTYFDSSKVIATSNKENSNHLQFNLYQNFPNPFNPITRINFEIAKQSEVKIIVYNLIGEQIKVLIDNFQKPGSYFVDWDGVDSNSNKVSSGVYLIRLYADSYSKTIKTVFLK